MGSLIKSIFNLGYKPNGKRIKANDGLIISIWKNEDDVVEFCKLNSISKSKYYRIKNWKSNIKNKEDIKRLKKLEKRALN